MDNDRQALRPWEGFGKYHTETCPSVLRAAVFFSMGHLAQLFRPPSLGLAVVGATLSGCGIIGVGIGSIAAAHAGFSLGIGAVLIVYGALVLLGAYLGLRRSAWARGMIVAPALLHIATAVSLLGSDDTPQSVGSVAAIFLFVATVVAAVLPSTHRALGGQPAED